MKINLTKKFTDFFTQSTSARKIDFVVLHHVEANSVEHAIEQFEQHQVSAHFLIDENGEVFLLVDENDVAYHAGISFWRGSTGLNKNSIGIEFINKSPFAKKFSPAQMKAGVELCQYLIKKYKIAAHNIVGHSDIAFYAEQEESKTCLISQILSRINLLSQILLGKSVCGNKPLSQNLSGMLDRKQDPSHLFDWKFFAQNGVGVFPETSLARDKKLFKIGDQAPEIKIIKEKLAQFGYQAKNLNDEFNLEMQMLSRVFNRRFNPKKFKSDSDIWYLSSQMILDELGKN